MLKLIQAADAEQLAWARQLFVEYAEGLGLDLCFQNFAQELAQLPGSYAPPRGRLLLALSDASVAGCVGLRPLDAETCEMKRLFVRPQFRGQGVGLELARGIIAEACKLGYKRMRLDTIPSEMSEAVRMYRALGFREIEAYYHNPYEGVAFMELEL